MISKLVLRCPECKEVANCRVYANAYDEDSELELKMQCCECGWVGFKFIQLREMITEQHKIAI